MNKFTLTAITAAVAFSAGILVNIGVQSLVLTPGEITAEASDSGEKKPLYWVAPMDPNYKRDKPGKSPMGMDLVPVYEEAGAEEDLPGTVSISPAVVNNLGVRSAPVITEALQPQIRTVGLIGYNEDSLKQVNSRVEGWVENLQVGSAGEQVRKGDKLFDLYSPALVNAQEELLSALKSGNRSLVQASRNRLKSLDISESVIEQVVSSRKILRTLPFYAEANGVVSALNIREGGYINPSKTLIELASLETVWVVAEVFESQSQQVAAGQKAQMSVDYLPGEEWVGEVDYVYPELDPKTRSLKVRLRFDNPGAELKPNMYSRVSILPGSFEALSVPRTALIRTGEHDRVVKDLDEGRFRSARVETGREVGDRVEVLRGLKEGDKVVTSAQFLLDSESSISAELSRFEEPPKDTAWVDGTFLMQTSDEVLNIAHGPVQEWGWPGMIMDFNLSPDMALPVLESGQGIRFEVEKLAEGGYQITQLETVKAEAETDDAMPAMDHSKMGH